MMKNQLQTGKDAVVVELKSLGYSKTEMNSFQKTTKCPRCGADFSNIPYSGRWLAHFGNCNGKTKKAVKKPKTKKVAKKSKTTKATKKSKF